MKSKKGIIILSTVVLACAVGFIVSPLVDWPVDKDNASGNIAKSSRFSRKTAAESLSNMEELLATDENYKNTVVASHVVMQTRVRQFGNLVNLSNEAAGEIPEFASLLKEMNEASVTANNACLALLQAKSDINAALNGNECPDLAQNTLNASLAYSTLQKQNKLADRFIETTDKYLEKAEGSDCLKLVRDQWVEYQLLTAALDGDEKSAQALKDKGYLLTSGQSAATLQEMGPYSTLCIAAEGSLLSAVGLEGNLSETLSDLNLSNLAGVQDAVIVRAVGGAADSGVELGGHIEFEDVFNEVMDNLYGESAANLFGEVAANLYGEAAANLFGESAANLYGESAANLYGESAANLFGELAATLYGESAANLFGEAAANLYGESAANLFGEAAANLYGESAANLFGEVAANLFGESAGNLFQENAMDLNKLGDVMTDPVLGMQGELQLNKAL